MSGPASTPSGRYRVLHRLASGGMGEVELAVREEGGFRRVFAIKRLTAQFREDASARTMFLDEARLAGLVRHPNVVSVLDLGEDERGPYFVMEFVEGISASMLLRWAAKNGVSLPVQLCLRLIRDSAMGLHAAHELTDHEGRPLGLVHRDVSPQNVLIGFDGIACVADFGIAKAAGRTTRTTTGLLKGKAGYMSPEQLRFEDLDRRSDVFSLAVVLYEILASRRLYRSENDIATARRILHEPPPDIDDVRGDVPPEVVELLFACLSKDPSARPATAGEVAQRLDAAIARLVQDEGVFDAPGYLRTHFAGRRAELQEMLSRAPTETSEPDIVVVVPRPRRWWGLAAAAALVTATLSIAAWRLASSDGDTDEPRASTTLAAPPEEVAPPPVPGPAHETPPPDPPVTASVTASTSARMEASEAPDTRAPARSRRTERPSTRGSTRRPRGESTGSEHGLFRWE